ncbi:glycosyltransferase family 2 protein [Kocuria sp. M1R5S2]|uniref:glycosyltransferase family 2 protein n=1 Tax=Kocuria rhizosphaerae TaxID=3376285 RepID=UPI00378C9B8A
MTPNTHPAPAASIIVPTRGGAGRLPILLESLERQTRRDFEVVVVVDGDVDGTAAVLEDWAAKHPRMELRSIVFPENRGRSAALNAGNEAALGGVLIRCDDDLEPAPEYVHLHITSHTGEMSGVIGLTSNVYPGTSHARAYGTSHDALHHANALALPPDKQWRHWAGNVSLTRAAWELVGGYDEDYRRYGWEDVDYGYRLHAAGIQVRIVPKLTTRHHVAATTTAVRAARALHSGASREIFLRKHGADVLPAPADALTPWNIVVRAVARRITEPRIRRWGKAVDRVADRLPATVSRKLVALVVESAARAGVKDPARARSTF